MDHDGRFGLASDKDELCIHSLKAFSTLSKSINWFLFSVFFSFFLGLGSIRLDNEQIIKQREQRQWLLRHSLTGRMISWLILAASLKGSTRSATPGAPPKAFSCMYVCIVYVYTVLFPPASSFPQTPHQRIVKNLVHSSLVRYFKSTYIYTSCPEEATAAPKYLSRSLSRSYLSIHPFLAHQKTSEGRRTSRRTIAIESDTGDLQGCQWHRRWSMAQSRQVSKTYLGK
jgi:hypothetical protein